MNLFSLNSLTRIILVHDRDPLPLPVLEHIRDSIEQLQTREQLETAFLQIYLFSVVLSLYKRFVARNFNQVVCAWNVDW